MDWGRCSRCENHERFSAGRRPVPGGMEQEWKWLGKERSAFVLCDLWAKLFILMLNSVFLGQMQSASMSRNVQLKCHWELLEEVHNYNDPSMCIQLLFCKGQKLWKRGDSLDKDYFQNWLPGLLEPNTDVHTCFSFIPEVLPYKRICVMVWEEMIKGENE